MTIASEIQRIQGNINNAYNACINKGATLPQTLNSFSLASTIDTISTGSTINNQDLTIVSNGVYTADEGYTGLGTVTVAVPSGAQKVISFQDLIVINPANSSFIKIYDPVNLCGEVNFCNLTTLERTNGFLQTFYDCTNLTGEVNFCNLYSVNEAYAGVWGGTFTNTFMNCSNITGMNFRYYTNIMMNHTFTNCSNLQYFVLPTYATNVVMNATFYNCINLTGEVNFTNAASVSLSYAFYNTNISGINLNASYLYAPYAFARCKNIDWSRVNFGSRLSGGDCHGIFLDTNIPGDINWFSNLSTTSFSFAFSDCPELNSVNLHSIKSAQYGAGALEGAFRNCTNLKGVDLTNLSYINCTAPGYNGARNAFNGCTNLREMNFPNLTYINGVNGACGMFEGCTNLQSVNFPNLASIYWDNAAVRMFYGCTNLTSFPFINLVNLSSGNQIAGYAFKGCTNLVNVEFSKLTKAYGNRIFYSTFANCTNLRKLSFPSLINISTSYTETFKDMLSGCDTVEVHFNSSLEPLINTWTDVQTGFNGTNVTVLFDL